MGQKKKDTLFVNLFAGPGGGKSTLAAGLFYRLKLMQFDAELIQEYAKDKTWEYTDSWEADCDQCKNKKCQSCQDKRFIGTLGLQPYVTGKQFYRCARVDGKVDIAVTDSPILNGLVYQGFGCTPNWEQWVIEVMDHFWSINIFLGRNLEFDYKQNGRSQTLEQSIEKDTELYKILQKQGFKYHVVNVEKPNINDAQIHDETLFRIYSLVMDEYTKGRSK